MTIYSEMYPTPGLVKKIMTRIVEREKYIKYRNQFLWSSLVLVVSTGILGIAFWIFLQGIASSGFSLYFNDALHAQESIYVFMSVLVESFPVLEFALLMCTLLFLMITLRFSAQIFEKIKYIRENQGIIKIQNFKHSIL